MFYSSKHQSGKREGFRHLFSGVILTNAEANEVETAKQLVNP